MQNSALKALNALGRALGWLAVLWGAWAIFGSIVDSTNRVLNLVVGLCALLIGVALILVRRSSQADVKRLERAGEKLIK